MSNPFENKFIPSTPDVEINKEEILPKDLNFVGNEDQYDKDYDNYNYYALGNLNKQFKNDLDSINTEFNNYKNRTADLVWCDIVGINSGSKDIGIYGNGTQAFTYHKFYKDPTDETKMVKGDPIELKETDTGLVFVWQPRDTDNTTIWSKIHKFVPAASILESATTATWFELMSPQGIGMKYAYIKKDGIEFPNDDDNRSEKSWAGLKILNYKFVLTAVYIIH